MKYTLKLDNVTLEASETHDRNYLKFGNVPVSKKQLEAIGFRLTPKADTGAWLAFIKRKFGITPEMASEQINKMRRAG